MTVVPITVRIPVPSAVRGPRRGRPTYGYVWVDREIEVPSLGSEATCVVNQESMVPYSARAVRGACAGGSHWRHGSDLGIAVGGIVKPFSLGVDGPIGLRTGLTVDRGVRSRVTVADGRVERVRHASASILERLGLHQRALWRSFAAREGGSSDDPDGHLHPFGLRDGAFAEPLDRSFEEIVLDAARRDLAVVDGTVSVRSDPPETVLALAVYESRIVARTSVAYADAYELDVHHVATPLPLGAVGWIEDELAAARSDGPYGDETEFGTSGTGPEEGLSGEVVTPPVDRGRTVSADDGGRTLLTYDDVRVTNVPLQAVPSGREWRDMSGMMSVGSDDDRPWTRVAARTLEFRRGLETKYGLVAAPQDTAPELDALDVPAFAP